MKLNKGRVQVGMDADLTIVDTDMKYIVDPKEFASKGKNTPFAGWQLQGRVLHTYRAGKLVF